MIINVRGTNGSGKSEAVRRAAEKLGGFGEPVFEPGLRKPSYTLNREYNLAILGHYGCQCGGADRLRFSEVRDLVLRLHGEGWHVLFESMLFSVESKQTLLMYETIQDIRVIVLNVSPEQAIRNIYARREKTGNRLGTKLDEDRVRANARSVEVRRLKMLEAGVRVVRASVDQAAGLIVRWVREG